MAGTGLSLPIFSQRLIDDFLPNQSYEKAIMGVVALGFLLSFRTILAYYPGVIYGEAGQRLEMLGLVSSFYRAILRFTRWSFTFEAHSTGDLIARMNEFVWESEIPFPLITGTVHYQYSRGGCFPWHFVFYQSFVDRFYLCLLGVFFFLMPVWNIMQPILAKHKGSTWPCTCAEWKTICG